MRLTTDKPTKEMGMYELAHNSCYIDKDGNTRYRDFNTDVDARMLARELLKKYADGDDAFTDDDNFDDEIMELLQYGTRTIEGLIALFYRNLWAMSDLRETLKQYEDLEEQGLLIKLPCKVGDTIYRPIPKLYKTYTKSVVKEINISGNGISYNTDKGMDWRIDTIGRTAFLTQEEAEQVLKLKREITTRFEKVSEWNDELDFYMDLLEIGITVDMVRKYMNDETANHMQKYCEEHGLI